MTSSAAAELALTLRMEAAAQAFGREREAVVRSWRESLWAAKPEMTDEAKAAAEIAKNEAIKGFAAQYVARCAIARIICHEIYESADYHVKMTDEFDGWIDAHDGRHPQPHTDEARAASDVCKLEHMLWSWRKTMLSIFRGHINERKAAIEAAASSVIGKRQRPDVTASLGPQGHRILNRKIRIKRNRPS